MLELILKHIHSRLENMSKLKIVALTAFNFVDFSQIYWLGDLNYRVTNMSTHQVKELINRNDLRMLLLHDQLNKQIELKKVLQVL